MNIKQGRIGRQESAAVAGIAAYTSLVFTMDSQTAYTGGNSTFIWMPLSVCFGLGAALFIIGAMQKFGADTLDELIKAAFGKVVGSIVCLLVWALLTVSAIIIMVDFVDMIHSFVFYDSGYWEIALWVLLTTLFIAFMGLECISRTALIILPVFLAVMLFTLLDPIKSYELHHLSPFPGNTVKEVATYSLNSSIRSFGAFAALLTVTDGVQGIRFGRSACIVGAAGAAALALMTQLAISLCYSYIDLLDMYYPLYRLDMMMVEEGYFFRMDKLRLFFWLAAGIVSVAYYIYTASVMWCRCCGPKDTRPAVAIFGVIAGCAVLMQAEGYYDSFIAVYRIVDRWGWMLMALLVASACVSIIRQKIKKGAKA